MWSLMLQTLPIKALPLSAYLLLLILVVHFWKSSKLGKSQVLKSPPGPWKLPILGNLLQLAGHPLPHYPLRDLAKKYGPIMHLKLGQSEAIIISSRKAALEVLKTHEITFAQRPLVLQVETINFGRGSIAFAPYGDFWREVRKICVSELLSVKHVQAFRSIREEEVKNFVESISSSSSKSSAINFSEESLLLTNGIISRAAFGNKCKYQKEFLAVLDEALKLGGGFDIPDLFPSLRFLCFITGTIPAMRKMRDKIGVALDSIIDDHKRKRSLKDDKPAGADHDDEEEEDLVDVLLKLQESSNDFKLTTGQIKDVVMEIFVAGSETSATTLEWAMSELLRNPRVMKKAQSEVRQSVLLTSERKKSTIEDTTSDNVHHKLDYLRSIVKETLRLHPPTPLLSRESRERCEVDGYELPAKTKAIINVWALARDPEQWGDDADSFKPERFLHDSMTAKIDFRGNNFELLPFGAGRRICPGMSFANAVIEPTLFQLLYRFDWELADGIKPDELDMTESWGATCRKRDDLYVIATPHFLDSMTKS
ncbi:putative premnaspirodiene oxygenase [Rosa chinensis]|uniref:Putative premnaspirodiene oxygenase n=2 Tax=Rosa chinensis TaxID=74649 RepID=A0A2P6PXD7_ROSCH|nr:putative premnaspirodiene oxygenase [Rosa chinensis]